MARTARPPIARRQDYAMLTELALQDDAVLAYGEMTACLSWWTIKDFEVGDVSRCGACYETGDSAQARIAAAYRETPNSRCPRCFGTTFDGGVRSILYRPCIWTTTTQADTVERRGHVELKKANIQTVSDLSLRDGDVLVRADGSRWKIDEPEEAEFTVGFGPTVAGGEKIRTKLTASFADPASSMYLPAVDLAPLLQEGFSTIVQVPHPADQIFADGGLAPIQKALQDIPPFDGDYIITVDGGSGDIE